MAKFEVPVVRIDSVCLHPNADHLAIAKIGGYTCIIERNDFGHPVMNAGDLAAYIPAGAVMPEWLLKRIGMWRADKEKGVGTLGGSKNNRVKPVRLRGIFSEGLVLPVDAQKDAGGGWIMLETHPEPVSLGDDLSKMLGIVKYEPPIPESMRGDLFPLGRKPLLFDLEPIEKFEDAIDHGATVCVTEKLHGTMTGISIIKDLNNPNAFMCPWGSRDMVIWSKGLGGNGLVFKDTRENRENIYILAAGNLFGGSVLTPADYESRDKTALENIPDSKIWRELSAMVRDGATEIHIMGETIGNGVQDLNYGHKEKTFYLFGVATRTGEDNGTDGMSGTWMRPDMMRTFAEVSGVATAPMIYEGPFNKDLVESWRDGNTLLGGGHIREGAVIVKVGSEKVNERLALKSVSPDYKTRKNGTEFS